MGCVEEAEDVTSDVELLEEVVDDAIGKTAEKGRGQYCWLHKFSSRAQLYSYTPLSHSPKAIVSTFSDTPNMLLALKLITYIPGGSSILML